MDNLIDRDVLMTQLEDRLTFLVKEWGYRDHYTRGFEEAVDKVGNAPTVDALKVVHARWITKDGKIHCSHCDATRSSMKGYEMMVDNGEKWVSMEKTNFCPNCGADMRGEGNG